MQQDRYVKEQLRYYRERASEYDEWFLCQGRYDRGAAHSAQWFAEVEDLERILEGLKPFGKVLELACGTGWWTEQLVKGADSVMAVDASSEVLSLNAERLASAQVSYVQANIFDWQPEETYDLIFFSFWLSHIPPERFVAFWQTVAAVLAPGGRVFLIDSLYHPAGTARDQALPPAESVVARRKLNDGRSFDIIKVFYTPPTLSQRLEPLGWHVKAGQTDNFFVYAELARA